MKIILLRGIAGSGKSTLAKKISEKISAPIISKDVIFDTCLNSGTDWDTGNKISYEYVYNLINDNKSGKSTVILDVGLHKNEYAEKLIKFCIDNSVNLKSIVVTCSSESEWRSRFDERKKSPRANQTITDFDEMSKYCRGMEVDLLEGEMLFDSASDKNDLDALLDFISSH